VFQSDKQATRQKMLNGIADKMKKLEDEKNAMSLSGVWYTRNNTRQQAMSTDKQPPSLLVITTQ
jgi:hypothetical protein